MSSNNNGSGPVPTPPFSAIPHVSASNPVGDNNHLPVAMGSYQQSQPQHRWQVANTSIQQSQGQQQNQDRVFRPMETRPHTWVTEGEAIELLLRGFSPNYRGNPALDRNRSASIVADKNCSLFITGLAPDLTTADLLGAIRDVGRVYATHINGPEIRRGHKTCAAKVVFFERKAAERFYDRYKETGFAVPGSRPEHCGRVVWNRIRSDEVDVGGRKSRVLLISGPPELVNPDSLRNYLAGKIQFQVESVRTLARHSFASSVPATAAAALGFGSGFGGCEDECGDLEKEKEGEGKERALVEFRFGSYRCQAESARMALTREFKEFGVFCEFGEFLALSLLCPFRFWVSISRPFLSPVHQPSEKRKEQLANKR